MTKRKPTIYVDLEVTNYFSEYYYDGSNGERLRKIRNIVNNIFDDTKSVTTDRWLEWLIEIYGVSRRTAREYMNDAKVHTERIIEEIAQKA